MRYFLQGFFLVAACGAFLAGELVATAALAFCFMIALWGWK